MNKINQKKYDALVSLLKPVGPHGMKHVNETPWSLEETRTFTCSCGHKHVIQEAALSLLAIKEADGSESDHVNVNFGENTKCIMCGGENYELLSFCARYGLLRKPHTPRKKKQDDAMLPFDGFIVCKGGV